jgi:poly(3-hydroxybutyrate) depolymerase
LEKSSAALGTILAGKSDAAQPDLALSKPDAEAAATLLGSERLARLAEERKDEMEKKTITLGDKSMRWLDKVFGEAPADGRSLWISMHGGGGAPARVNDGQWRNQIGLYEPAEGIYIAPRAPTDTWNLWHERHIDPMFQRLIEDHVALRGVNPDKVYLLGYSAGGDGVWQLAPRMADRFAAAAMMAGHPNESSLLGLRNLPFAIFMGAKDAAYDRNKIALQKSAELATLEKADPGGYVHMSRIYEGLGHWMNRKDAEALPWMAKFHRNPWPAKVVWYQDDVIHRRFYWLRIPEKAEIKAGGRIDATVDGQTIRLEGDVPAGTGLGLSDKLLDLDREIEVMVNQKPVFNGKVPRTIAAIRASLAERADPKAVATALLTLP